jgi:hypothetical protein
LLDYFHAYQEKHKSNNEVEELSQPAFQHKKKLETNLVPYICETMNMYSIMCNSRNYTWKKFAENFFNVESLVENLLNKQFSFELRAIICNMLNKLYVD